MLGARCSNGKRILSRRQWRITKSPKLININNVHFTSTVCRKCRDQKSKNFIIIIYYTIEYVYICISVYIGECAVCRYIVLWLYTRTRYRDPSYRCPTHTHISCAQSVVWHSVCIGSRAQSERRAERERGEYR